MEMSLVESSSERLLNGIDILAVFGRCGDVEESRV